MVGTCRPENREAREDGRSRGAAARASLSLGASLACPCDERSRAASGEEEEATLTNQEDLRMDLTWNGTFRIERAVRIMSS